MNSPASGKIGTVHETSHGRFHQHNKLLPADLIVCPSFGLTLAIVQKLNNEVKEGFGWRIEERALRGRSVDFIYEYKLGPSNHLVRNSFVAWSHDVATGFKIPVAKVAKADILLKKRVIGFVPLSMACFPVAIRTLWVPKDSSVVEALDMAQDLDHGDLSEQDLALTGWLCVKPFK